MLHSCHARPATKGKIPYRRSRSRSFLFGQVDRPGRWPSAIIRRVVIRPVAESTGVASLAYEDMQSYDRNRQEMEDLRSSPGLPRCGTCQSSRVASCRGRGVYMMTTLPSVPVSTAGVPRLLCQHGPLSSLCGGLGGFHRCCFAVADTVQTECYRLRPGSSIGCHTDCPDAVC